jgi:hypothetical protein
MQARFEREITTLRVLHHPNIMTCVGENLPERTNALRDAAVHLVLAQVHRHGDQGP